MGTMCHPNISAGWWLSPTPLKNMSSSVGMIISNIWENTIHVPNHQHPNGSVPDFEVVVVPHRTWAKTIRDGQGTWVAGFFGIISCLAKSDRCQSDAPWCWNMNPEICPNKITQSCRQFFYQHHGSHLHGVYQPTNITSPRCMEYLPTFGS